MNTLYKYGVVLFLRNCIQIWKATPYLHHHKQNKTKRTENEQTKSKKKPNTKIINVQYEY